MKKIFFNYEIGVSALPDTTSLCTENSAEMEQDMVTGKRIAMLRKEKGWGQKNLASLLKVSVSTVSNYEQGVHLPDLPMLCRLTELFGVSADYLLGITDCRRNMREPDECMVGEYSFKDFDDIVVSMDKSKRNSLVQYAKYLLQNPISEK